MIKTDKVKKLFNVLFGLVAVGFIVRVRGVFNVFLLLFCGNRRLCAHTAGFMSNILPRGCQFHGLHMSLRKNKQYRTWAHPRFYNGDGFSDPIIFEKGNTRTEITVPWCANAKLLYSASIGLNPRSPQKLKQNVIFLFIM